jgi:hypothetical protein
VLLNLYIRTRSRPAYQFTSTASTEGAVLLLPDGASRKDLRNRKPDFQQYAIQNAHRWYHFANCRMGRDIPNGSLMLVTGCDMASSWGIASFSDVSADTEVELSFIPSHPDNRTYPWRTNVSATLRASPEYQSISGSSPVNRGALNLSDHLSAKRLGGLTMAPTSRNIDANHGTFNEVGGNQINNITNHIVLPPMGDMCKL